MSLLVEFSFDILLFLQFGEQIAKTVVAASFNHPALVHLMELNPYITYQLPAVWIEGVHHPPHECFHLLVHLLCMVDLSRFICFLCLWWTTFLRFFCFWFVHE